MAINPTPYGLAAMGQAQDLANAPLPLDRIRQRQMEERELSMQEDESRAKTEYYRSQAAADKSAQAAALAEQQNLAKLEAGAPKMPQLPPNASRDERMQAIKDFQIETQNYWVQVGRRDIADELAGTVSHVEKYGTDFGLEREKTEVGIEGTKAETERDIAEARYLEAGGGQVQQAQLSEDEKNTIIGVLNEMGGAPRWLGQSPAKVSSIGIEAKRRQESARRNFSIDQPLEYYIRQVLAESTNPAEQQPQPAAQPTEGTGLRRIIVK